MFTDHVYAFSANLSKQRQNHEEIVSFLRKFCRDSKKMTDFEDFSSYNVIATYKNNTKYGKEKESEESRVTGKEKCR